ncbi:MAG: Cof-type HAD-IIB family hydrolase [Actinomycetia bacterium]|nr:Cof-type HAD-IIB family hydrolase [Actinomycetes bacterium]
MVHPIRLIATDLDGTLLRSDGTVSVQVRDAVLRARAAGIEVVPATGRPRMIAEDVIQQLDFVDHWIFSNGSVTWHLGRAEVVRGFWLDAELARRLIVRLRAAFPAAGLAIEFEDTASFESGFERIVPRVPDLEPIDDVLVELTRPVQKILIFDESRDLDDLFNGVSAVVGDHAVPSYSGLAFIELAASLVTKAMAVELLAGDLGIGRHEVAAFGDNHNDISMLSWAGRSYAMANGSADAKEAAGAIIGANDDDAVADQIDALIAEH